MNRADSKNINSSGWTDAAVRAPRGRVRAAAATAPLLTILLGGIFLAGCIIIPVDYHATGSRHNVTLTATNVLHPGITTREDVLLALGEPDFVSEDGQRFGYFWSKVKAIWAVASYGGGVGGEIRSSYLIVTSFDPSNRVSAVRLGMRWGDSVSGDPNADELPQGDSRGD